MQGFNMGRYVPPDQEGLVTSGNRLLGIRAQKANADGIPIVRFEMPFAVWCDGCERRTIGRDGKHHPVLIGQGVRFNAEKHRTGNYYTSPIFTFRMRHPACGTWLAIRTDPATTSYLVVEGGRKRREYDDDEEPKDGDDDDGDDDAAAGPTSESARVNAFDKLERTIAHRAADDVSLTARNNRNRIADLTRSSARQWDAPYERNRALRAAFRAGRHAREQAAADDDGLRRRLGGLSEDLRLLPASEADARMAALVDFGSTGSAIVDGLQADVAQTPRDVVDRRNLARPLFGAGPGAAGSRAPGPSSPSTSSTPPVTSSSSSALRNNKYAATTEVARRQRAVRDHLASTVMANTRMKTDPFVLALDRRTGSPGARGHHHTPTTIKAKKLLPIKGSKSRAAAVPDTEPEPVLEPEPAAEDAAVVADLSTPTSTAKRKRHQADETEPVQKAKVAMALVSYDSD